MFHPFSKPCLSPCRCRLYGDLEIKVADPVVEFCETVVDPGTFLTSDVFFGPIGYSLDLKIWVNGHLFLGFSH
jgi:hypothetical protein